MTDESVILRRLIEEVVEEELRRLDRAPEEIARDIAREVLVRLHELDIEVLRR